MNASIGLLLAFPVAVAAQAPSRDPLCLRVVYDSAQRGGNASMFPPVIILMPGPNRGEVRLPDSSAFLYYVPGNGSNVWSYRDGHYSLMIEGGESGVLFSLDVRGDSLVGSARHYTDNASAPEPTMRAIGTRYACPIRK
jgi:hypothetical protein